MEWTDGSHVRSGIFLPTWWLLGYQNGPCPMELVKSHWTQMPTEVLEVVTMRMNILSGVTPFILEIFLPHLGGTCCLHCQARIVPCSEDGGSSSSETSINLYEIWLSWVRASQIYSNIYPIRCNFTQFIYIWKMLYMFRVLLPPIIRSAYNCIYSIWYLSHRYCYLPL